MLIGLTVPIDLESLLRDVNLDIETAVYRISEGV